MYAKQTFPSSRQELAIWQPWRVGPGGTNYRGLGDVTDILASIIPSGTSTFAIEPTLLYAGLGLLGVAALWSFGGKTARRVKSSRRKRAQRSMRISQAKAALQAAKAR
jgi:hypothetical protein